MANKNPKSKKKEDADGIRCQITLRDPQTVAFLTFFPHRKGEVIQAALEKYIRSDNRHTRELQTLLGYKQADIDRLKYTLAGSAGSPCSSNEEYQTPLKTENDKFDQDYYDYQDSYNSEVDNEEDEEVMGDLAL